MTRKIKLSSAAFALAVVGSLAVSPAAFATDNGGGGKHKVTRNNCAGLLNVCNTNVNVSPATCVNALSILAKCNAKSQSLLGIL
jgi:hypothetical protein